jgi:hypothetical protein
MRGWGADLVDHALGRVATLPAVLLDLVVLAPLV